MEQAAFVDLLRQQVVDPATHGTISQIENPAGRNHPDDIKRRADWLRALPADERAYVEDAIAEAAHAAIFGTLCVLDGARVIEDGENRGHLELRYVKAGSVTLLASSAPDWPAAPLHELL